MLFWQAGWLAGGTHLLFQSFHHWKTRIRNVVEVDQRSASQGLAAALRVIPHTSLVPAQSTQTMYTEGMLRTFSPTHTHTPMRLFKAWCQCETHRALKSPLGFCSVPSTGGRRHPQPLMPVSRRLQGQDYWNDSPEVHTQAGVKLCQLRHRWPVPGFSSAWLTPMMLCPGSQGACPKGMMPLIYKVSPTENTFLECSLYLTDLQKISPWARKSQLKTKLSKQTPNPLVCSLDCKTYFQEQERASQELQQVQDNIWSTHNFLPQPKSCEYWLTLSHPNFITLDFTRKHVTCKWRHGLPHTQILLKLNTYFTHKLSGSRCTRLWYLIHIYRTWAHCSFTLEYSPYSHCNS